MPNDLQNKATQAEDFLDKYSRLSEQNKLEVGKFVEGILAKKITQEAPVSLQDGDRLAPEQDRADRYPLAKSIAAAIAANTGVSVFSINGDWGTGKSVLINWVGDELVEVYKQKVKVIRFDAWKYESLGNLAYPLVNSLKDLDPKSRFAKKIDGFLNKLAMFSPAAVPFATYFGYKATVLLLKIVQASKLLREFLRQRTDTLDRLHEDFQVLVDGFLVQWEPRPDRLVFLIDELDRCSPDNVVRLLESIKNFLRTEHTCFVIGMDRRIVAQGVSARYGNLDGLDGDNYLNKIVQFSYELPFDVMECTRMFVKDCQNKFPSIQALNLEFVPSLFRDSHLRSIRTIKRVLNRFVQFNELVQRDLQGGFDYRALFLLMFLYEVAPKLYSIVRDYPDRPVIDELKGISPEDFMEQHRQRSDRVRRGVVDAVEGTNLVNAVSNFISRLESEKPPKSIQERIQVCLSALQKYGA